MRKRFKVTVVFILTLVWQGIEMGKSLWPSFLRSTLLLTICILNSWLPQHLHHWTTSRGSISIWCTQFLQCALQIIRNLPCFTQFSFCLCVRTVVITVHLLASWYSILQFIVCSIFRYTWCIHVTHEHGCAGVCGQGLRAGLLVSFSIILCVIAMGQGLLPN